MAAVLQAVRARLRRLLGTDENGTVMKIRRRNQFNNFIWKSLPIIRLILLVAGYAWMLAIPLPNLGRKTYIDENALQPGQVNTYWNWPDVLRADRYLADLEGLRDRNASSAEQAAYIVDEFKKLGIPSATQAYSFTGTSGVSNGTNAYAIHSSPRASGAEAILISASRISRTGDLNLRGISTVISLAAYLKGSSLWAKDLIFVISDDHLLGMQAWITSYHGSEQSGLVADPLTLSSGVIWTALNIDYPGHSFSHLGVFFEGLNGRLPNQDLINSFGLISVYTGGVPILLYDHRDPREVPHLESKLSIIPSWLPEIVKKQDAVKEYGFRAKNILRHVGYQARGQTSGVHGLLHRFRIDAITLFAVPATGPHGFHAIGRIIESTLRTMNNLLERLHASFFFYLLVLPSTFLKIGTYLPSVILVSVSMMFTGLGEWVDARWYQPKQSSIEEKAANGQAKSEAIPRPRPVLKALSIVLLTHLAGIALFYLRTLSLASGSETMSLLLFFLMASVPLIALTAHPSPPQAVAPLSKTLKAFNLCFASTVISVTSVLNFSLAAALAVSLGVPLSYSSPSRSSLGIKLAGYTIYAVLGFGWLVLCRKEVQEAIWNWEVLGAWFALFVCIIYSPLVLQAAIVSVLPP
ncbi:unnamed protein product [Somion occarium]|uniref:GPI transamidase component gaa1 n=1 Tax=Somion occarium TaxID=3059160 RepID=A0ABP1DDD4_9APHY